MTKKKPASEHKPKGRRPTRVIKLDATPEEAARAMFSAVKPPGPTLRTPQRKPPAASTA